MNRHRRTLPLAYLSCLAWLAAAASATAAPVPDAFAEVHRVARQAFEKERIWGMGLAIYDAHGTRVFEQDYGEFSPDKRIAIASASKLVAGLTILRLIDRGQLSLKSTTGEVLGWKGPQAAITLEQLLSFTSGLPRQARCTNRPSTTLADCVHTISTMNLVAPPGTRFDYANTHLHVAARMAEVATGKSWDALFDSELRQPLGLSPDARFYTWPQQSSGTTNPLIAGGLRMTMNEYARVLDLEYHRGMWRGARLIGDALFTAQATEPYPNAKIGFTPVGRIGVDYHYGLASWLHCAPPAVNCPVQSSPGAFGFTPWVDRTGGYYAMIAMDLARARDVDVVEFSVKLALELQPLIREAMKKTP